MNEQRFALSYRESVDDSGDTPGLVLGDDGNVYVVSTSGVRTQIGVPSVSKLDPFTTVTAGNVVVDTATGALTLQSGATTTGVLIQNTGSGPVKISSGSGGIDIGEFNDAAYLKMLSAGIDIHASTNLTLHGNGVVVVESASGASVMVGTGSLGGNGGLLATLPSAGATPTLDLNVGAGAARITGAGSGILNLTAGAVTIQGSNITGINVSSGGGHPVVALVPDAAGFLGFFGTTAVNRISGATLTTVSQLVAALQNYGLLGP